jgi:hypothetical protein
MRLLLSHSCVTLTSAMTDPIQEFEADCAAAGVAPLDACIKGGVHRATWFRWKKKDGGTLPNLRNLEKARRGLEELAQEATA